MARALASILVLCGAVVLLSSIASASISLSPFTEPCNGQGIVYSENYTACECFDCFYGTTCENVVDDCVVNVAGGNPTLLQEYWAHIEDPHVGLTTARAYYRSPYDLMGGLIPPAPLPAFELDNYIREAIVNLHKMVGNAETEGKYIVYGTGATQLINAAAYARAVVAGETLPVFAQVPYYGQYKAFADFNMFNNYWDGSYNQTEHVDDVIEFVTHPNNPDGVLREPHYSSSSNLVYDMVYYWPSWTTVTDKADHDIMLFSLSKLTGHAGTRFGWALVEDLEVAEAMREFVNLMNIHVSIDAQHRAVRLLSAMVEQDGLFFSTMAHIMESRYARLLPLFEGQTRFSLESVTSPDTWFYMWVKANDGSDMEDVLEEYLITGEGGSDFGAPDEYARIQLTVRSVDFELFLQRFTKMLYPNGNAPSASRI